MMGRLGPSGRWALLATAILGLAVAAPVPSVRGQVAFQPTVSSFPDGVTLGVTPVVSADRRYVRMGINPVFTGLQGFDSYSVPAAVGGFGGMPAGLNGVGGGGGGGRGGGGMPSVGLGMNPTGFATAMPEASAFLSGSAGFSATPSLSARAYPPDLARRPTPKAKRATRPKKR